MKKSFLAMVALFLSSVAFAQVDSTSQSAPTNDYSKPGDQDTVSQTTPTDTVSNEASGSSQAVEITDDDLKKYAQVVDSVNSLKQELLSDITDKVKSNPKITVSRYMELSKASNDEAKLKELKATPEEIAFVKEVTAFKNEEAAKISETVQQLAKDHVGLEKYNQIREQLTTDSSLKARYEPILAEVQKNNTTTSKK